jgi:heme oxygenase (biliverdin-producing, ferredoxin)
MPPGLAERLRDETRPLHLQVERAGIMPTLLSGELQRAGYCALLRNLFEIYRALEDALARHAGRPEVAPVVMPELFRGAALVDDLDALHGPDWRTLALMPAACTYVERLRAVDRTEPARLVAHAYVRYLGDLSGGQVVDRIVGKSLSLADDKGRRFYAFGDRPRVHELAARFRLGLDCTATGAHAEAIVDEARLAFRLHARLFEELAG